MTQDDLIAKYVALRDKKASVVAAHKLEIAKFDETLDKVEALLLKQFSEQGVDSVRCSSGTAFKHHKTSVTVADKEVYLNWIKQNDAWEFLDIRPAKKTVEAYKDENQDIPPGINWRDEITVQVRRAS